MKTTRLHHFKALALLSLFGCSSVSLSLAESNLNDESRYAYGGNLGWIDWKPDLASTPQAGGRIENGVCSGYIYSANVGWIHLGDGSPINGNAYANDSEDDYGVNVESGGRLVGLAYSANVGWVNFGMEYSADTDAQAKPRVIGGKLYGYAYGANVGWLNLGLNRNDGSDSDGDGIPDSWEMEQLENNGFDPGDFITVITETSDNDGDSSPDIDEYAAGTDPFDGRDFLEIIRLAMDTAPDVCQVTWTSKPGFYYDIDTSEDLDVWQVTRMDIPASMSETTTADVLVPGLNNIERWFVRVVPKRP